MERRFKVEAKTFFSTDPSGGKEERLLRAYSGGSARSGLVG
jgi:hypothetical protein